MTTDLKKTLPLGSMVDPGKTRDETDDAMRTTLVQRSPVSRHPGLAKTLYWEERPAREPQAAKRSVGRHGITGKTRIGLGPNDDPAARAMRATKLQPADADRARAVQSCVALPDSAGVLLGRAKTMLRQATDNLRRTATHVQTSAPHLRPRHEHEAAVQKWRPTSILLALAAVGFTLSVVSVSYLIPTGSPGVLITKPPTGAALRAAGTRHANEQPQPGVIAAAPAPPEPAGSGVEVTAKQAIDALFAGDYTLAGRLYASLAAGHSEQPALAEAARILRRRAMAERE